MLGSLSHHSDPWETTRPIGFGLNVLIRRRGGSAWAPTCRAWRRMLLRISLRIHHKTGAGCGDRTRVGGLEGRSLTTRPSPQVARLGFEPRDNPVSGARPTEQSVAASPFDRPFGNSRAPRKNYITKHQALALAKSKLVESSNLTEKMGTSDSPSKN